MPKQIGFILNPAAGAGGRAGKSSPAHRRCAQLCGGSDGWADIWDGAVMVRPARWVGRADCNDCATSRWVGNSLMKNKVRNGKDQSPHAKAFPVREDSEGVPCRV